MEPKTPSPYQKAHHIALELLARRRHSREELRRKLSLRGFEDDVIGAVLTECDRFRYIDDETAADFFMEELIRKRVGIQRIREEMKRRGFSDELTSRMIDSHHLPDREPEIARSALDKKRASLLREPAPWKRREKMMRFLQSRGFCTATIYTVLDEMKTDDKG
jgi:regulatory protein